jgi:protein-tyrosine phosphatase
VPSPVDDRPCGRVFGRAVIDLHSHILPGVDDGAQSIEDSVEIASAAVADGIDVIAATPHVRGDYPTDVETMEALVAELRAALVEEGIALDVRTGGEIALEQLERLSSDELRRFGLAGNQRYLLVEFSYYGWPLGLPDVAFELRTLGITAVLAHPERNAEVQAEPERLRPLVDAGVLVQVTAASLDGRIGRRAQSAGLQLVETGLAHLIASDAHSAGVRAIGMRAAAEAVGDADVARWLTSEVPGAIVSGAPLPPRPERRRRLFARR